jgi:hypothetical protein
LKSKYLTIRFLCEITNIILIICFFIGNIESKNLLPFVFINSLICLILNYKGNKAPIPYTKYDGMKKILSGLMFFWIVIILMMIFGK